MPIEVVVVGSNVNIDAVDGIGESFTLETKKTEDSVATKKVSSPRLMQEVVLRRQIVAGMQAKDLHAWYRQGEARDITIAIKVAPEGASKLETAYTITLIKAQPTRWFFEYKNVNDHEIAWDCLAVIARDVKVE